MSTLTDGPTPPALAVPGPAGGATVDPVMRAWADRHHIPVDAIHGPGNSAGFDGALEYLAAHAGRATAVSAAKMIDYPTTQLRLTDRTRTARTPMLLALGVALVAAAAASPTLVRRARRRPVSRA